MVPLMHTAEAVSRVAHTIISSRSLRVSAPTSRASRSPSDSTLTRSNPVRFMDVVYTNGQSVVSKYELGSYGVFGFNVGYNWKERISVRAGVNNLFDKTVLRTAGTARTYNERRRSYYMSMRYSF